MKEQQVKIIAGCIVEESITLEIEIKQSFENILTYVNQVEKLYIYLRKKVDIKGLIEKLNKYPNVEIAECFEYGEAEIYKELINKAISEQADYITILKPDYFFENESFLEMKKYVMQSDVSRIAVLTPMPLFGCELHERKAEEFRAIKGCRAYGALLNLHIYSETRGIKEEYYQTTFDYDYCLQARLLGYDIMLAQNLVLRKQNYKVLTKKIGFITLTTFDRDLLELYYETRNRYYLWDEYKKLDPAYVSLDKKLAKKEQQEIRAKDKNYREKFLFIERARLDYKKGRLGQIEFDEDLN